jgi:copper chaperone CopZ
MTYKIEGMHCQHCVAAVKKAFESFPEIEEVTVSLDGHKLLLPLKKMSNFIIFKEQWQMLASTHY